MATKLMLTNKISDLLAPSLVALDCNKGFNFWRQCQCRYTFQPIYRTSGTLLAIELLTAVYHPSSPETRLSPEDYFSAISIRARLNVVLEQLELVRQWHGLFTHRSMLVSINIDGQALMAMQNDPDARQLIESMPYVRFELVEHMDTACNTPFSQIAEADRLWLDDFGCGVANFSSFVSWRYEYIKIARDLFILLQQSEIGQQLFFTLVTLMSRYSKGVIVEGVETDKEWALVKRSDACAAQGYYLSRPAHFDMLQSLPLSFAG
ncbi:cyclic-guanylate-specific phosphodiesterase [Yersinia ruckeri]|uniref:EAL domain-containing protein n=1 Tax=Yersinia ruckeri TaxID=29486 RepID=A0A0A8VD59_YERRU|nr:cyclic-guanylate-specific phosphodiesterase [Yersinia ruckeri]EEP97953.1 Cyclic diguanylate phosphodiesterase (EAL) domain protein [Yersinia ruckeri ATCC 29473]ELI6450547.1 cyclic-guanylate-specific phosphodiesterase [Yersinia ruckeri]KGA44082.1 EAL domain protein [Yersinia ruckeri ATCC 29473]MCK8594845.1 cyclic-guanylate-specific phosphodiesterase [Yersinia ruckeri]MCK8597801.1 cyclic-guanylate-specific phosphodiesterase [Yersinia ruckeri]